MPARQLQTLQALIRISAPDSHTALTHTSDVLASAFLVDKVDIFQYEARRDSLVALGSSAQPLSNLQKQLGLDVLPVSNGGRVVQVYKTGRTFMSGTLDQDSEELKGIKEGLRIRSELGVPLLLNEEIRGVVMLASLKPDFFTESDRELAETAAGWIAAIMHRAELTAAIEKNAVMEGRRAVAEELVTEVAHDLRNHVSPISLRLYSLRARAEQGKRTADLDDIRVALRGITRLNQLIANILDIARLDEGLLHLHPEHLDLCELVRESAEVLSTKTHGIDVRATAALIVTADRHRLKQCIENLLSNAIGHSPNHAPVDVFISVEKDGAPYAKVEIVDEGPGVPDDLMPRVFERFVSGRPHTGLGMGLFVAKRLAAAHGGELVVDRYPGKGARFTLCLPLSRLQNGSGSAGSEEAEPRDSAFLRSGFQADMAEDSDNIK